VPGWEVSGKRVSIPKKRKRPTKKRPNWTFRHEEYLAGLVKILAPVVYIYISAYLPNLEMIRK
jgi:hypothetical protein